MCLLSSLAYLALCLLIAAFGVRKKHPCDGHRPSPAKMSSAGENGGREPVFSFTAACLLSLSSFLFMPCGAFPALYAVSGGALIAAVLLAVAPGPCGSWKQACRQSIAPLVLGASLAVMAHYARQRGVPGDLYTLDAYVAMSLPGVADGAAMPGVWILAGVSLWALWMASSARQTAAFAQNSPDGGAAILATLAAEIRMLALIGFWVCLFFPFSLAHTPVSGISIPAVLTVDALLFWGKILLLKRLLDKRAAPPSLPLPAAFIPLALWGLGAWLLLTAA